MGRPSHVWFSVRGSTPTALNTVARKSATLFTEPIGWLEKQFRAAGHDKDSRELATHLFSAFQGMAAVAHGANDPEVVVMEVRRLKNWINTL